MNLILFTTNNIKYYDTFYHIFHLNYTYDSII